jgi:site-specific DNA recombinase
MIAAIYARKSTDQSVLVDEAKSVARQIEHARDYVIRKGWSVADQHIYVDDGISGAEFANRPGFLRLMNAVKPRAPFHALVMSEESRLGREAIETAYALKQLVTAGVRVFFYLDDRERTLESPTDKIMLSLTAFADELEREKARQRTYDAMTRKARAGHVTGGRVFGYDNVEVLGSEGRRSHVERRINEAEAAVIRRIFEMSLTGAGLRSLAKQLNEENVPAPRAQQGRPKGWAPSSVREVLYRDLYRGLVVWNRTRKRDPWGRKRQRPRPDSEWMQRYAPELRIISEDLWSAVHARLENAREIYRRKTQGKAFGRPTSGIESKHLLAGLATCGQCGGSLVVVSRKHGRHRQYRYACSTFHRRGRAVCSNSMEVLLAAADEAVLRAFENEVLDQGVMEATIHAVFKRLEPGSGERREHAESLRKHIAQLEIEIARLTDAIAAGAEGAAALVDAIRLRERRLGEAVKN